jgi:hypothetical protein
VRLYDGGQDESDFVVSLTTSVTCIEHLLIVRVVSPASITYLWGFLPIPAISWFPLRRIFLFPPEGVVGTMS